MVEQNKQELMQLLKQMIAIPSVTGTEAVKDAIEFVKKWLEEAEIGVELTYCHGVPNLIAEIGSGASEEKKDVQKEKRLLWNSHVDVVPAGDFMHWSYPPFYAWEEGGYLYGRGASDAKSGLAAMMMALKLLHQKKRLNGTVELMVCGAEENGSEYGTVELLKKRKYRYDAAIVAEPSDMCIEIAQRGLRWLEIRIHGIASHGARPYLGVNAITQAGKIINALEQITCDDVTELFEKELQGSCISVNKIHGGIQNNITAEECKMVLDCRLMPGQTQEQMLNQIKSVVDRVVDSRCHIEYTFLGQGWDPFILEKGEPIVQNVKNACQQIRGDHVVIRGKAGCTDASHIYKKGIPVLILGSGNPNESHRSNEKVCFQNVVDMVEILMKSAEDFLGSH